MLAIALLATHAFNPFAPPRWNARRRLANRMERTVLKETLNAQQGLIEYERERLKLSALNVWHDWYTPWSWYSPFALSEVSRTARQPPIWPVLAHCRRVCWQSFRAQDFPQSDDRVLLQLQDLAATNALITDALSFGFSVSFVSPSAPSSKRQVWIAGGRRALQSYVGNVGERVDAPVTVTWASDGTAVLQ